MLNLLSTPGLTSQTKLMVISTSFLLMTLIFGLMQSCGRGSSSSSAEPSQPEDVTPTHTPSALPIAPIEEDEMVVEEEELDHVEEGLVLTQGPSQGEMLAGGVGQSSTGKTTQYYTPSQPGIEGMAADVALSHQAEASHSQEQDVQPSQAYYSEGEDGEIADDDAVAADDGQEDELAGETEEFEEPAAWTMISKAWDQEPCAQKARVVSSYGKLCVADRITLFGRPDYLTHPTRKGGSVSMGISPDHWQRHLGKPGPTKIFHVKSVEITPQRLRLRFGEALNRIIINGLGSTEQKHPIATSGINFHGSFGAALRAIPGTTTISHLVSGQHYDMYLNIERRSGQGCLISFALVEARNQKFVGYYYGTSRCYR